MQNVGSAGATLKELQKFPEKFTFKIVGDNTEKFIACAKQIFDDRIDTVFTENVSSAGKYISISATTEVWRYEELEAIYTAINKLEGLKFHV